MLKQPELKSPFSQSHHHWNLWCNQNRKITYIQTFSGQTKFSLKVNNFTNLKQEKEQIGKDKDKDNGKEQEPKLFYIDCDELSRGVYTPGSLVIQQINLEKVLFMMMRLSIGRHME